jgi:hypothetical protein
MIKKIGSTTIILFSFLLFLADQNLCQEHEIYNQEKLYEDARQLATTLEAVHPDPYINGGGKIAFHRRFQKLLTSISHEGMTKKQFYDLLLPFVAAVGDSHTGVLPGNQGGAQGPGLPFKFQVVEKRLYVAAVQRK